MSEGGPGSPQPENDIFTVLIAVAAIFVMIATIFTSVRANELFDNWLPF